MSDLSRFHNVQQYDYEIALDEIKQERKRSHWMWYIFPQLAGLGRSSVAQYYGIADLEEAVNYLRDPVLGSRLIEISTVLLQCESNDALKIFGPPDDIKLRSSMTLFDVAAGAAGLNCNVFSKVLEKFFDGKPDKLTLEILQPPETF